MTETADEVLTDLTDFLNRSVVAHGLTLGGLGQLRQLLTAQTPSADNPDPTIHVGTGNPNLPQARVYGSLRRSQVLAQVAVDGSVATLLGQQWVVYTFTGWEHGFRPRLANAHGCETKALEYPLLGDLRHFRNDIVHHHGLATAGNSGRCQVLGGWVHIGQEIKVRGDHLAEFMDRFPWAEMASGPATTTGPGIRNDVATIWAEESISSSWD